MIVHPFEGYWDLKYENRGRLGVAYVVLALVVIAMILRRQYAGFLVNYNDPRTLSKDRRTDLYRAPVLSVVRLQLVGHHAHGREGKFKEIVMASAYALIPMVLIYPPMTLASRFMVQEETVFYYLLTTVAAIWFIGSLCRHDDGSSVLGRQNGRHDVSDPDRHGHHRISGHARAEHDARFTRSLSTFIERSYSGNRGGRRP